MGYSRSKVPGLAIGCKIGAFQCGLVLLSILWTGNARACAFDGSRGMNIRGWSYMHARLETIYCSTLSLGTSILHATEIW
jgi:hypothetical protein